MRVLSDARRDLAFEDVLIRLRKPDTSDNIKRYSPSGRIPALQIDGGDVEFVGVDDNGVLQLRLVGACGSCPISSMTVKHGIERRILATIPEVSEVQAI